MWKQIKQILIIQTFKNGREVNLEWISRKKDFQAHVASLIPVQNICLHFNSRLDSNWVKEANYESKFFVA